MLCRISCYKMLYVEYLVIGCYVEYLVEYLVIRCYVEYLVIRCYM